MFLSSSLLVAVSTRFPRLAVFCGIVAAGGVAPESVTTPARESRFRSLASTSPDHWCGDRYLVGVEPRLDSWCSPES